MTDKTLNIEIEALKADLARLHEEIAGLAAGVNRSAGIHAEQTQAASQHEGSTRGEEVPGGWTDLLHKLDSSRIQGEKVVRDLEAEVERHPLVSILAAFGLGYIIAKLWYQENKQ